MKYNRKIKRMNSIHSETLILTPSVRWVCKPCLANDLKNGERSLFARCLTICITQIEVERPPLPMAMAVRKVQISDGDSP